MGRSPCCDENTGLKKGPWTQEEDEKLLRYIHKNGHGSWRTLPSLAGLNRCGKSCRLRWTNYLRPDIKRGKFSAEEERTILRLHAALGNRWSAIAAHLPGRTDNEVKNFWNTHLRKRLLQMGLDPVTHRPRGTDDLFAALIPHLAALAALRDHLPHLQVVTAAADTPPPLGEYLQQCLLLQPAAAAPSADTAAAALGLLGGGLCFSPQLTTSTIAAAAAAADDGSGGHQYYLPCAFPDAPGSSEEEAADHQRQQEEGLDIGSSYGRADDDGGGADVFACNGAGGGGGSLPPLTDLSDLQVDGSAATASTVDFAGSGSGGCSPLPSCNWPELFFPDDDPFITDFL